MCRLKIGEARGVAARRGRRRRGPAGRLRALDAASGTKKQAGSNKHKRALPMDETRRAPSLVHQRRARGRPCVDQLACSPTSLSPSTANWNVPESVFTAPSHANRLISNCFESADRSDKARAAP